MSKIIRAKLSDLDLLLPMFNSYRTFYRKEVDANAKSFLETRLKNQDSAIFIIMEGNTAVGFTQLYSTFSSLGLGSVWILNDLYVVPEHRRKKVAWKLLQTAVEFAKETKAINLTLSTQISNVNAREMYKKFGFKKDNDFFYFNLSV